MNCTVYSSKTYSAVMLAGVLAMAAGFTWFFQRAEHLPFFIVATFALFLGLGATALIYSLVSGKPVVRVDETGILYHPRWLPLIEWPDIIAVERKPLTERTSDGTHTYLKDGWRPIWIIVRNPEKYLQRVPSLLRGGFYAPDHPGCARIEIAFMGMKPGSGVVHDYIRQHLARHGVAL